MKAKRQAEILRIIAAQSIETQEQLLQALLACGIGATQATVSRDIKELRLVKELSPGGEYRYAVSKEGLSHGFSGRLRNIFREGVISVEHARNLVVIKTMPGLASAAGAALDSMGLSSVVGTLAGDDTALIIMREDKDASELCDEIHRLLK